MKKYCLCLLGLILLSTAMTFAQDSKGHTAISVSNIKQVKQIAEYKGKGIIWAADWSPDGNHFAVLRYAKEPSVEIWDLKDDNLQASPSVIFSPPVVNQIHWLPDGKHLVTHGNRDIDGGEFFYVAMWDTATGKLEKTLLDEKVTAENCCDPIALSIVGWNRDYSKTATLRQKHGIELSDGKRFTFKSPEGLGSLNYTVEQSNGSIVDAIWSPDDRYIAVEHATEDTYQFHIIDSKTLESVLYAWGPDYWTCEILWSPDETTLAVASEWLSAGSGINSTNVRFYRIGEEVRYGNEVILSSESMELGTPCKLALDWSPDSQIFAAGSPTEIRFYETSSFEQLSAISETNITTLSWHPSGKFILTGDTDGIVRLWGVQ